MVGEQGGRCGAGRRLACGRTPRWVERGDMSEDRSDVGPRASEIRRHVLACLRKRERRALFVTELIAALRKAHGVNASDMEQALAALEADWTVVIRDLYYADPHLE